MNTVVRQRVHSKVPRSQILRLKSENSHVVSSIKLHDEGCVVYV